MGTRHRELDVCDRTAVAMSQGQSGTGKVESAGSLLQIEIPSKLTIYEVLAESVNRREFIP